MTTVNEDITPLEEDDTLLTVQKLEVILAGIHDKNIPICFSTGSGWITDQVEIIFQSKDETIPFSDGYSKNCLMIYADNV